jgi:hypothetical protein
MTVERDPKTIGRRGWVSALLAAAIAGGLPASAPAQGGEAAAKARFAVTLARFVQWPASPVGAEGPLRLCVLQRSPALASAFAVHDGAAVGSRRLVIVFEPGAADMPACDLLFVDASAAAAAGPLLTQAAQRPVLTIGAVDGFLGRGGMIELVNVDDALRYDVDLGAVRRAGLGLSSQVLKLARRVRE